MPTKQLPRSHCLVDSGLTDGIASGFRKWKKAELIPAQGYALDQHLSVCTALKWSCQLYGDSNVYMSYVRVQYLQSALPWPGDQLKDISNY